jgi:hypothetical protein
LIHVPSVGAVSIAFHSHILRSLLSPDTTYNPPPDCAVIQFTSHAHVSSRLVSHFLEQLLYLAVVWGRHAAHVRKGHSRRFYGALITSASSGGAPCNPVTAPGKMTPAGRQQEKQRSIAAVLGRWSGAFKPAHNRAALAITDPPFPPSRASLSNHDVQHGPIPQLYR